MGCRLTIFIYFRHCFISIYLFYFCSAQVLINTKQVFYYWTIPLNPYVVNFFVFSYLFIFLRQLLTIL